MSEWKLAWSYVPIDYHMKLGILENMTQRAVFRNNLEGNRIRIRFCNLYQDVPMRMKKVTAAVKNRDTGKWSDFQVVTKERKQQITIGPGEECYSDEINLSVHPTEDIVVSICFEERLEVRSVCITWSARTWDCSLGYGDQTEEEEFRAADTRDRFPFLTGDVHENRFLTGIHNVAVYTQKPVKTIALFGDSITHMSYYSDPLSLSLYEKNPGSVTVLNGGIGGNRLIADAPYLPDMPGEGKLFGDAGVKRFKRDVFTDTIPDIVFCMEGINDCMHGFTFHEEKLPTGAGLLDGLNDVIGQARRNGAKKVYVSTIMPGTGTEEWKDQAEAIRMDYNDRIRQFHQADDMIDLDHLMRKADDVHSMQEGMHLGDGLHPNKRGGEKMAEAILQKWFLEL